jgi:nucleotide-binding universal stress UspA family protein
VKRILVPLDGSSLAEAILPDGCDLAGHGGELILLHVIRSPTLDRGTHGFAGHTAVEGSEQYLDSCRGPLCDRGFTVKTITLARINAGATIDEVASMERVDLIACATHGRGLAGRLIHGSVMWKVVANSTVPVFMRHLEEGADASPVQLEHDHIMVPLDGSTYAEKALPVADWLSMKWNARVSLVRVVEHPYISAAYGVPMELIDYTEETAAAKKYLEDVACRLPCQVNTHAWEGQASLDLVRFAKEHEVTHVVIASHGRTAMSRVILGSVADQLVHQLHCPIIVIPALAPGRVEDHARPEPAA